MDLNTGTITSNHYEVFLPFPTAANSEDSPNSLPAGHYMEIQLPVLQSNFLSQNQSQSYFTTGGLQPVSSSWRQAP
jgi:hypothetical protein